MGINWDGIKFRASSWANLLTEPKEKSAKDKGELSITCQKELLIIYEEYVWGRKQDITTKQMEKGLVCENDGITLYSRLEKRLFIKNEERLENDWATGHPDIYTGESILKAEEVDDMKISWNSRTFLPNILALMNGDKNQYEPQLNVYFDLTGAKKGGIVYTLVSAPMNIIEDEKRKLLYKMDVATEENDEFKKAAAELERNMIFEDIDYRERCVKIPVKRNDELIEKMKNKVPRMREWLHDFHKTHMGLYPKTIAEEKVLM